MITSWQRRRNDQRGFMHGYEAWLARRVGEDGGVGWLVRNELEQHGDAVLTWRADMEYQRKCRRYRPYAMKREKKREKR